LGSLPRKKRREPVALFHGQGGRGGEVRKSGGDCPYKPGVREGKKNYRNLINQGRERNYQKGGEWPPPGV